MTNQFGLIGFPLSHSFSKGYFAKKFERDRITNCHYDNYPLENIEEFKNLISNNKNMKGLNVTIPYKELVMPFLDDLDDDARSIGAVNTVQIRDGQLKGFNTDVYGFMESLKPFIKDRVGLQALILGTGGASKAVAFGLTKLDIPFIFVSRSKSENAISYGQLSPEQVGSHQLIINTTPLGMYPKIDNAPPLAYGSIGNEHILYDLVYNPEETLFLSRGKENGAKIKNGLEMLHLQAEKAWEIWNQ